MTTGYGGATTSGTGTISVIQYLPASVTRLQVHIRNWNPRYINADRDTATLANVRIGRHTTNGNGTDWVTLPSGATAYTSGWLTVPLALRGAEVVVQYTWTGSDVTRTMGTAWSDGTRTNNPELWTWLEVEVPNTTPVVAAYGSSTAAGVGATRPVIDSWLGQWARANGAVPAYWAHSGDSASSWTETANRKWELYGSSINAPNVVLYAMGSNDWAGNITAAELRERVTSTVAELRRRIGGTLYGTTITPRSPKPDNDNVRTSVNAWMPGSGLFDGVIDLAGAVSLADGTLDPAIDSDGTHVTTAGHARLAAAVPASIVTEAANYDTGYRDITSLIPADRYTSGQVILSRRGDEVTLQLVDLVVPLTGTGTLFGIPAGFRPFHVERAPWFRPNTTRANLGETINASNTGTLLGYAMEAGAAMTCRMTWTTQQAWPTTLPGTPA
jgi:hypothetical protein